MERRADREANPTAAKKLRAESVAAKAAWGCELGGCHRTKLGPHHVAALGAIKRMTGWSAPPTCPRASLSHPALVDALRLLPAAEHGTLPTLDHLPAVLHDAVHAAAQGKGERWEYEQKIREQNRGKGSG